ncbi:MAG: RNA polymerase sigma factor RpoD/SigA [Nanopusillaceae archaeon]
MDEIKDLRPLSVEEERVLSKEMKETFKELVDYLLNCKVGIEEIERAREEIKSWGCVVGARIKMREEHLMYIKRLLENLRSKYDVEIKRGGRVGEVVSRITEKVRRIEMIRDRFIKSNLKLVLLISRKYRNYLGYGFDLTDLIQEGNIGLIKAAYRYDGEKGFRFSTYAMWWIRHRIVKYILEKLEMIRVPILHFELRKLIVEAAERFRTEHNREATLEELASYMEMSERDIKRVLQSSYSILWLDAPVVEDKDGDEKELKDFVKADEDIFEGIVDAENKLIVSDLLSGLKAREERVIRLRFGIGERESYTLEEVGRELGISKERVRQIERDAIRKMRAKMKVMKSKSLVFRI